MRWKVTALGLATALIGSLVLGGTATSSGLRSETIWLYAAANEGADTYIPVAGGTPSEDTPPAIGDRNISRDDLFAIGGTETSPQPVGPAVGRNDIDCTFVEVSETEFLARLLCHGVIEKFSLGTISWQAVITFSEATEGQPFEVAITGGTGIFADAGGEIIVHSVGPPTEEELDDTLYEIRLLRFVD